jgi:uncharacterized protein (DUF1015 family)
MAKIAPFTVIHYNLEIVDNIGKVVAPPYDIIDAKGQEEFYQKHPYNVIRLILGKELAGDKPEDNKYTRAAAYLEEWQRRNILAQDSVPAVYFYEQDFIVEGQKKRRLGFIALLRLEEEGEGKSVYPHEHTHTAPKEDRLKLLKSVEANLSPIFTIFSDPQMFVKGLFKQSIADHPPLFEALEGSSAADRIWRVTDAALIDKIRTFLIDKEIFIADGHHRYEVARMFREYKKAADPLHFKDSYNYVMTYFTPLEDPGLCVFPTHRLIKGTKFPADACAPCFTVRECSSCELLVSELKKKEDEVGAFGLYRDKKFYLLKLSDKRECNRLIQEGPKEYKNLDVVILHKVLFDQILKVGLSQISYEVDLARAITLVDGNAYDALFILNPTKIEQIRSIALGGEVMPQKSTYFYPKLMSGFLIHKF